MKKIITLFQRNCDGDRLVRDEITPGAEWVVKGIGFATRKFDGTCCMVRNNQLFKRYDAKHGKTPPPEFEPAQEPDEQTGHWPGWLPVSSHDRWHMEAWRKNNETLQDGTYELVGPKINSNPEKFCSHELIPHGIEVLPDVPRTFERLKTYLTATDIEGIVWWEAYGRAVKIKKLDFGIKR